MSNVLERFLRYVKIETTSCDDCRSVPSTPGQFDLARLLVEELHATGLEDAAVDEHCYVTATLPSNLEAGSADKKEGGIPVIGWIAHLDTSPDVCGKNVKPRIIDYRGGPITLPNGTVIPEDGALRRCLGHRIVTSDGTTLLGADDKAGIAAIMEALARLQKEKRRHGTIRLCFTPDEEVGNGTKFFDLAKFGAAYAYTVDGELPGEINRETFSALAATLQVTGCDIHPGYAKGIMVNALRIAAEIVAQNPKEESPETTEGYEPYIHPIALTGTPARAEAKFLLRAFADDELERLRKVLQTDVEEQVFLNPGARLELIVKEQYRNMRKKIDAFPLVSYKLEEAVRRTGLEPVWKAIRGGTDGSRLTEMGLPTPNIFTGGHRFHSTTEWISVEFLEKTVETLLHLAEVWCEEAS